MAFLFSQSWVLIFYILGADEITLKIVSSLYILIFYGVNEVKICVHFLPRPEKIKLTKNNRHKKCKLGN